MCTKLRKMKVNFFLFGTALSDCMISCEKNFKNNFDGCVEQDNLECLIQAPLDWMNCADICGIKLSFYIRVFIIMTMKI